MTTHPTRFPLAAALSLFLAGGALAQTGEVGRMPDRTFDADRIAEMRAFYVSNATGPNPLDCITTMNKGLRILYGEPSMKLGSTIDRTMAALRNARPRRAAGFRTRHFYTVRPDGTRRPTIGITRPDELRRSIWDYLMGSVEGTRGFSVFGLSPMDGYHSVFLIVDNREEGATPKVYWADQWSTKGGWMLYPSKEALDGEVETLTSRWWQSKFDDVGYGFKSRCRLYQLIPSAHNEPGHNMATVIALPRNGKTPLPLRTGPAMTDPVLTDGNGSEVYAYLGDEFPVMDRGGSQNHFVKVLLNDGREAWAPAWYFHLEEAPAEQVNGIVAGIQGGQAGTTDETHTVVAGDSLWKIATTHDTSVDALKALNGLNSDTILIGDVLRLPRVLE